MDDQSASSRNDPFGLVSRRRTQTSSGIKSSFLTSNASSRISPSTASSLGVNYSETRPRKTSSRLRSPLSSDGQSSGRNYSSVYGGKPPISKARETTRRFTEETVAATEGGPISPPSPYRHPIGREGTNNGLVQTMHTPEETTSARRVSSTSKLHTQQSIVSDSAKERLSRPSIQGIMRPINLANFSPEPRSVFSQLSQSDDDGDLNQNEDQHPNIMAINSGSPREKNPSIERFESQPDSNRRLETLQSHRHQQYQANLSRHDDVGEESQTIGRRSTISSANSEHYRLSQTVMVQLQKQLQQSQQELLLAQEERDEVSVLLQEYRQKCHHHEQELADLRNELEHLTDTKSSEHQQYQQKQKDLELWQSELEEQSKRLQEKSEHVSRKRDEWNLLQQTVQELQVAQQEEERRLVEWSQELENEEKDLRARSEGLEMERRRHHEIHQEEGDRIREQRAMLESWENRLQVASEDLEAKRSQVSKQEESVAEELHQLEMDCKELDKARKEMEAKNASYDAKYELIEQAVEELTKKRKEEEAQLQETITKREEVMREAEKILTEAEQVRKALDKKTKSDRDELAELQRSIDEKRDELDEIKDRIKLFLLEDQRGRQLSAEKVKQVSDQLFDLQEQVSSAQREKERLDGAISELQSAHETLKTTIGEEQEEWERHQEILLKNEQLSLNQLREKAEENIRNTAMNAKAAIQKLAESSFNATQMAAEEVKKRTHTIERLRLDLDLVAKQYREDFALLQKEKDDYFVLRESLNEKVAAFATSEGREKRLREEIAMDLQRVNSLLNSERASTEARLQDAAEKIEELRQTHLEETRSLTDLLEKSDSEKEHLRAEIRRLQVELGDRSKELLDLRKTSREEKRVVGQNLESVTASLANVERQLSDSEKERALLKAALDDARKLLDSSESKLHELQQLAYSGEETRVQAEELLKQAHERTIAIEENEKKVNEDEVRVAALTKDCSERLDGISKMEQELGKRQNKLVSRERHLAHLVSRLCQDRKKSLMARVVEKRWRVDQEAVAAAFSKWLRVTMFDAEDRMTSSCDDTSTADPHVHRNYLDLERGQLQERIAELESIRRDLDIRLAAHAESEARLVDERDKLKRDKTQLEQELALLHSSKDSSERQQKVERRMKSMESLVTAREAEMELKEQDFSKRDRALKARELESLASIELANEKIRRMTEQLRDKELNLEMKETKVTADVVKCENAQARIHKLTLQLQEKAEALGKEQVVVSQRMRDCDLLESQLKNWQKQLGLSESGFVPTSRRQSISDFVEQS